MKTNTVPVIAFSVLCIYAMLSTASAAEIELHVLQTGNTTYVWTDDMAPVVCNTTCDIEYDEDCDTTNSTIIDKLDSISANLTGARTEIVTVSQQMTLLQSNISTGLGNVASTTAMGGLMDIYKNDITTYMSASVETKLNSGIDRMAAVLSNETARAQLEQEKANLQSQVSNLGNQLSTANNDLEDEKRNADSYRTSCMIILVIFGIVLYFYTPLGMMVKQRTGRE